MPSAGSACGVTDQPRFSGFTPRRQIARTVRFAAQQREVRYAFPEKRDLLEEALEVPHTARPTPTNAPASQDLGTSPRPPSCQGAAIIPRPSARPDWELCFLQFLSPGVWIRAGSFLSFLQRAHCCVLQSRLVWCGIEMRRFERREASAHLPFANVPVRGRVWLKRTLGDSERTPFIVQRDAASAVSSLRCEAVSVRSGAW